MTFRMAPAVQSLLPKNPLSAAHAAWLFALSIVGYPIAGMVSVLANVPSTTITVPFRIIVVAYSVAIFGWLLWRNNGLGRMSKLILGIWAIYGIRLAWDAYAEGVVEGPAALLFFVVACVVPILPIMIVCDEWDGEEVAWRVVVVGMVGCLLGILVQSFNLAPQHSTALNLDGRMSFDAVNPITFGQVGATTLFAGFAAAQSLTDWRRLVAWAGVVGGLAALLMALSRGPMVSALVATTVLFVVRKYWIPGLLAGFIVLANVIRIPWQELGTLFRLVDLDRDRSALGRIIIQRNAISEFQTHPLLGLSFLDPITHDYPHNILIEAGMALGVVGLALVTVILVIGFVRGTNLIRGTQLFLGLGVIQYIVAAQFSGVMYGDAALWAFLAVVLSQRGKNSTTTAS